MMREVQERYFDSRFYGANPEEFICVNLKILSDAYNLNYLEIKTESDSEKVSSVLTDKNPWIIDVKISLNSKLINRYDDFVNIEKDVIQYE